jgi:hypothetical protein
MTLQVNVAGAPAVEDTFKNNLLTSFFWRDQLQDEMCITLSGKAAQEVRFDSCSRLCDHSWQTLWHSPRHLKATPAIP